MPKYLLVCTTLLTCLLLQCHRVKAQLSDVYVKGKITLQNNLQKEGFIKRDELENMSQLIYFKETEKQKKPVKYDTVTLMGYTLETGEVFERLRYQPTLHAKSRCVFGSLMLRGKASLYEIISKGSLIYIISNDDATYVLQDDELENGATTITQHYFKDYFKMALRDSFSSKINDIRFVEKSIVNIVTEYNKSQSYAYNDKPIIAPIKNVGFLLFNIGVGGWKGEKREIYFQGIYRLYAPKYSKSTCLNTGICYYDFRYSETIIGYKVNYRNNLISIPFQLQQNFLNKSIRPYIFMGANCSYFKGTNDQNLDIYNKGFQRNFGFGLIFGGGIEADFSNGFMAKLEARNEVYNHPLSVAIGYHFLKK